MKSQLWAALVSSGLALIWGLGAWRVAKAKESSVLGWRAEASVLALLCCQWLFCAAYVLGSSPEEMETLGSIMLPLLFVIPAILFIGFHVVHRLIRPVNPKETDGDTNAL